MFSSFMKEIDIKRFIVLTEVPILNKICYKSFSLLRPHLLNFV